MAEIYLAWKDVCKWMERVCLDTETDFDYVYSRMAEIPPADVRPVVRGQWKFATNPMLHDGPGPSCWCSKCKKPPIDKKNVWYHLDGTFAREGEEFVLSDFCPNCGADMREVGTEAIKRNTTKIVEKANGIYAEYIRHLQEKNKALDEELASLLNEADAGIKGR